MEGALVPQLELSIHNSFSYFFLIAYDVIQYDWDLV